MFIKIHSQPSTKPKSPPSEDTVGVRARGALLYILKGENSEIKSSAQNLARIRSGRNNLWYKLVEVAELGLGGARTRGYGTCSRSYPPVPDIARGFKMFAFFHPRLLRRDRMEGIMVRNKRLDAWNFQFECRSDPHELSPGAAGRHTADIPPGGITQFLDFAYLR